MGGLLYLSWTANCFGSEQHVCLKNNKVTTFSKTLDDKVAEAETAGFPAPALEDAAAGLVALAGISLAAASMLA